MCIRDRPWTARGDLGEDAPGVGQQPFARLGELHTARLAAEQLHLQLGFQCPDLLAQRRLLHAEPLGGAGDVAFLGDGDEVAQVSQVHVICVGYGYRIINIFYICCRGA